MKTIDVAQILSPDLKSRMRAQDLKLLMENSGEKALQVHLRGKHMQKSLPRSEPEQPNARQQSPRNLPPSCNPASLAAKRRKVRINDTVFTSIHHNGQFNRLDTLSPFLQANVWTAH